MAIKIIYQKSSGYTLDRFIKDENDYYILTPSTWNDYGYITMFEIYIIKDKEIFSGMTRRILFDDQVQGKLNSRTRFDYYSLSYSDELDDFSEYYNFISLGSEYKELKELFPDDYQNILKRLNDVIYLQEKEPNNELLKLKNTEGFYSSLTRDQSSKKSLSEDGNFLFPENYEVSKNSITNATNKEIVLDLEKKVNQFKFNFTLPNTQRHYEYYFSFHDKELPKRINVLVGKNGSGKSQTLKILADFLIKREADMNEYNVDIKVANKFGKLIKNDSIPFIQNTIVVAYNPYEQFLEYSPNIKDYSYLGFRRLQEANENLDLNHLSKIKDGLLIYSHLYEKYDIELKELTLLKRYGLDYNIEELVDKIKVIDKDWNESYIKNIIDMYILNISKVITDINLPNKIVFKSFLNAYENDYNWLNTIVRLEGESKLNAIFKYISEVIPEVNYIALKPVNEEVKNKLNNIDNEKVKYIDGKIILFKNEDLSTLPELTFLDFEMKLLFLDSSFQEITFSSGQEVFTNLIIYLISVIKKDSLVIIDEPENTLHPNFEVKYIEILYKLLEDYKSFCIIATHSSIIVREVPKNFIQIITLDSDNQPEVQRPLIQTFGSNLTTITNYIFDDLFTENKQFLKRLEEIAANYDSYESFENIYQDQLNYEMLIYIRQNWSNYG